MLSANVAGQNAIDIKSKKFKPRQLHADIDYAFKKFEKIHPDFFKETQRSTALKRFEDLKKSITTPLTRYEFMQIFTPVAISVIRDRHTFVFQLDEEYNKYLENGGRLFPIPVMIKNRKLYCNSELTEIPYNSEIIQINNIPSSEILEIVLRGYSTENNEVKEFKTSNLFSNAFWSFMGGYDGYEIQYRMSEDEEAMEIISGGLTNSEIDSLRFKKGKDDFEYEEIPELNAAVFKFNNSMVDLKEFRSYCDSIFNIIKTKDFENLIIDIRQNHDGTTQAAEILFEYITNKEVTQLDSFLNKVSKVRKRGFVEEHREHMGWFKWYHYLYYPIYIRSHPYRKEMMTARNGSKLMTYFPAKQPNENSLRFKGEIYLLTGIRTFSAANGLAAAFKCYDLGTIVGQETGQPTISTADWGTFELPNTKIKCAASVSRIYWACGKDDGKGVMPDFNLEVDASTGVDNEMEYVKYLILRE